MSPFLKTLRTYIKKEHYSNYCTFEIARLLNVPGHYLRKYGMYKSQKKIDEIPPCAKKVIFVTEFVLSKSPTFYEVK